MKPSTTKTPPATGFVYSIFRDVKAQQPPKRYQTPTFSWFAKLLNALPEYREKAAMPLICPMEFSGEHTAKGAHRSDAFVTSVWGVCGDHDAGTMTLKDAAARLRKAGVEAAFYTSPSHTEEHPRWRVVAPFKAPGNKAAHKAAVERLNHLLDGALTSESFALSQSFYIGRKTGAPFTALHVRGEQRIDEIDCPRRPWRTALKGNGQGDHVEEWTSSILGGEALHPSVLSFVGYLIAKGTPRDAIRPIVTPLIERAERDPERLQAMLGAELDRMIEGAFTKGYAARGLPVDILPEPEAPPPAPEIVPFRLRTAGEMMQAQYTPPEEIITGEIRLTPGAHVLAGKPKHGKSWLAMGLAVAVVTGEEYMGSRAVKPAHAIYIAADDTSDARFANRLKAVNPAKALGNGLIYITDIDKRAGSSLDLIAAVLRTDPAIRFVVIDTLSAFREKQRGDSPYQQEYDEVQAINKWAHEHNVCVLIVHHLRKGTVDTGDPFESISGTLGLQGGADGMLVLARKDLESDLDESMSEKLAGLWGKSRDIEEYSVGIKLLEGRWRLYGKIADVFSADTQREIMQVLRSDPARWWTSKEIHAAGVFDCKTASVQKAASRMAKRGLIDSHRGALEGKSGGGGGFRCRQA